ncbi:MAG: hypothetical protein VX944_04410 [Myxococcota bacterium]|nr:hypothetical protein [Myxococcota bacterium]
MIRAMMWFSAAVLLGAGDPWVDAADQDLQEYARAVSLDLRGVVPSEAELVSLEAEGELSDAVINEWLASPEFFESVVLQHRDRFWNELEINLLPRRRLVRREGITVNISRSRFTRGVPQTSCGTFEATVDEFNRPLTWVTNPDGSVSEGFVMVAPYWDPDTPIPVCALDAQLAEVSPDGVDCTTQAANEDPGCGCGPNLQWCMDNNFEQLIEYGISRDLNERVRHMVSSGEGYASLFDGDAMFVNGPSAHFYRHLAAFNADDYESPVAADALVDLDPLDPTFHAVPLRDHHDGVLTAPGWLLRHQTNRGRANRFYGAFLCAEFIPPEVGIEGLSDAGVPSPNLQMREGCLGCHARLEPWAAYWGRWAEAANRYRSPEEFPPFSEECAACAATALECSDYCEDNYVVDPTHSDEVPYLGWYGPYAFLADDSAEHPDLGPLGWVDRADESGRFSACAVKHAADWLLRTDVDEAQLDAWAAEFAADDDYAAMVKRIIVSDAYWGGAP